VNPIGPDGTSAGPVPADYDRGMPQYQNIPKEQIVTRDQLDEGYLERNGLVFRKRKYVVIRELEDGRFLVQVQAPDAPEQQ
jgi:hypothetical protein